MNYSSMSKVNNEFDHKYANLLANVFNYGQDIEDERTGVGTRSLFGTSLLLDISEKFPAITLRKIPWNAIVAENLAFIRGYDNAQLFRDLGCNFWTANANETKSWLYNQNRKGQDDLGRIYGVQWRDWRKSDGSSVDQFKKLISTLRRNPSDRRMIVSAWNPGELDEMALPPCHMMFQCYVRRKSNVDPVNRLDLKVYIRSWDLALGAPSNIAGYALLNHIICGLTDLHPGRLFIDAGDYHIYFNHFEAVKQITSRDSFEPPAVKCMWPDNDPSDNQQSILDKRLYWLLHVAETKDFQLVGYEAHPNIKMEMAV